MNLNFNLSYSDLYSLEGIRQIDNLFLEFLAKENSHLLEQVKAYRESQQPFNSKTLIELASKLEIFLAQLFNIEDYLNSYRKNREYSKSLYEIKRNFVHRYALVKYKKEELNQDLAEQEFFELINNESVTDDAFISHFADIKEGTTEYEIFAKYAAIRVYFGPQSPLFSKPSVQDFDNLIKFERDGNLVYKEPSSREELAARRGDPFKFRLLDSSDSLTMTGSICSAYLESSYCIYCHKTAKDSCSKGMKEANGDFKRNSLANILHGCPLDLKISEMNKTFASSSLLSSFAIAVLDNPMLALTGNRICNDCSKACIYQKQEPVDIPSIESQVLSDSLNLPYGFEIYSLLTRWNPLNSVEFLPKNYNGKKVLVVGLGPAGIGLSHYLLQSGCHVAAIDGLKIEKLPERFIKEPIKDLSEIRNLYEQIKPQGFGGVAEYGITDRWDKINLVILRLLLEKRANFEIFGGVKFGANITYSQAKNLGFDHIALSCGSGYPNIAQIKNIEAKGVRTASDFLMSLGSGGMHFEKSLTNFMIELPAVIIGAGLTAIDTAVEITKYYPLLCKKIYQKLAGKDLNLLPEGEKLRAERMLLHAKAYLEEDRLANMEGREADYRKLNDKFGGITICYRRDIKQSPAYRINHEELDDALDLGIKIFDYVDILEIEKDQAGSAAGLVTNNGIIPARTILFATGTKPLTSFDATGSKALYDDISIFGDMDQNYAGSVVKALASAKDGYKKILEKMRHCEGEQATAEIYANIAKHNKFFESKIVDVIHHSEDIFELKILSPLAAENYRPGQFFKLQNFKEGGESFEPLALTASWVEDGVISMLAQIVGKSSKEAAKLQKGDLVSLMGPCGESSYLPSNSSIILIGGGVGNAALFLYAKALKEKNNKIIFIAGYRKKEHCLYPELIRKYSDFSVFACDEQKLFEDNTAEKSIKGNVIDAMHKIDFTGIKNLFVVGSSSMMQAVSNFMLAKKEVDSMASINAPMQCMLGGVCGQCLMPVPDKDGRKIMFICKNQDQNLSPELMDSLKLRLSQNSLLEKIERL